PQATGDGRAAPQMPSDMREAVAAGMPQESAQMYAAPPAAPEAPAGEESEEEILRRRSTPAVRRLAEEHSVDLRQVKGTGLGGRVTREDVLQYVAQRGAAPAPAAPAPAPASAPAPAPAMPAAAAAPPAPM